MPMTPRLCTLVLLAAAVPVWSDENAMTQWHLEPFWNSSTMHGESVFFLEPAHGAPPEAGLLFVPEEILSIFHPSTGTVYDAGRDFTVDPEARRLTLPAGSRIPFTTRAAFEPALDHSGQRFRDDTRDIFFGEGRKFHDLQVEVTYTHDGDGWAALNGPVPESAVAWLPDVFQKLRAGAPVRLCLLGDSISYGLNASGIVDAPPHQPPYGTLVAEALQARYKSPITFTNLSVSGKATPWGIAQVPAVAAKEPDLVLIAFGMNDASAGLAPEVFVDNVRQIIAGVREAHPPASFLLVATMRGNADWKHAAPDRYPQYRDGLLALQGPGVAVADLTSFWTVLLERKKYADITGNGVNHPNDFGHRLYAQVLLALLAPPGA